MSRLGGLGARLYNGEVSYDFVGHRRRWYMISAGILLVALAGLLFRGLNYGIEFRGGSEFQVPASSCTVESARGAAQDVAGGQPIVTELGTGALRIQTEALSVAESNTMVSTLSQTCAVDGQEIKVQLVGPSWGGEITRKALQGLGVFLLLVTIFLTIYFEWRMAVSALVALAHDLVITIGIYALTGFEVTPATVIGVLTILGYSLYDTVVVFDKVKENTRGITGQSRYTYSQAANLALNQTLVRSINTSIVALLPVLAILFVGAGILGAGTLKDLALALAVGMAAGTYSSIFVATPLLAQLKEQQPEMKALAKRVHARAAGGGSAAKGRKASAGAKGGSSRGGVAVAEEVAEDIEAEEESADSGAASSSSSGAAAAARPQRPVSTGPRNQPRKQTRSKRGKGR
ncbi:MAG: protein translocase subunit SecF [Candidatus Nanopelagicales bacterium]